MLRFEELDWTPPHTASEAIAIQKTMRGQISLIDRFPDIRTIVGIDVSYDYSRNMSYAFLACLNIFELKPVELVRAEQPIAFPYVPGLLSFREIPVILQALSRLKTKPDLYMVDGQGIAHPRRMGIAAHLGVLLDIPTIGIAKSRLTGTYDEPGLLKGSQSPLMDKGERIGTVLRSRDNVAPLFISPGHHVSHESAVNITLQCLTRYRLPEPTRIADKFSKSHKSSDLQA